MSVSVIENQRTAPCFRIRAKYVSGSSLIVSGLDLIHTYRWFIDCYIDRDSHFIYAKGDKYVKAFNAVSTYLNKQHCGRLQDPALILSIANANRDNMLKIILNNI